MHDHPLNLALRFLLELVLHFVFGYWGWQKFDGATQYVVAIGLPLLAATIWAVFRVEGDPGKAVIAIPGWLRFSYEMILFTAAAFFLFQLQQQRWASIFIAVSALHYLLSYRRIIWLFQQ